LQASLRTPARAVPLTLEKRGSQKKKREHEKQQEEKERFYPSGKSYPNSSVCMKDSQELNKGNLASAEKKGRGEERF